MVFRANKFDEVKKVDKVDEIDEIDEVDEVNEKNEDEVEENNDIVDIKDYINQNLYQHSKVQQNLELSSSNTKTGSKIKNSLKNLLDKTY